MLPILLATNFFPEETYCTHLTWLIERLRCTGLKLKTLPPWSFHAVLVKKREKYITTPDLDIENLRINNMCHAVIFTRYHKVCYTITYAISMPGFLVSLSALASLVNTSLNEHNRMFQEVKAPCLISTTSLIKWSIQLATYSRHASTGPYLQIWKFSEDIVKSSVSNLDSQDNL